MKSGTAFLWRSTRYAHTIEVHSSCKLAGIKWSAIDHQNLPLYLVYSTIDWHCTVIQDVVLYILELMKSSIRAYESGKAYAVFTHVTAGANHIGRWSWRTAKQIFVPNIFLAFNDNHQPRWPPSITRRWTTPSSPRRLRRPSLRRIGLFC